MTFNMVESLAWGVTLCALCNWLAETSLSPASMPTLDIPCCDLHRRQAMAIAESIDQMAS